MLSLAFGLALSQVANRLLQGRSLHGALPAAPELAGGFVAIVAGFVMHELAHKVVAQRYGHWAEFRAQFGGLVLSVLLALGGFFLAAPGAVLIYGRPDRRENGVISLAGPLVNGLFAAAAWPLAFSADGGNPWGIAARWVAVLNAFLMVLNLLPVSLPGGNTLDGRKVWWWNRGVYALAMSLALGLLLGILFTVGFPG